MTHRNKYLDFDKVNTNHTRTQLGARCFIYGDAAVRQGRKGRCGAVAFQGLLGARSRYRRRCGHEHAFVGIADGKHFPSLEERLEVPALQR